MSKITHKEAKEIVVNWTSGKIKDDTERANANLKLNQYFTQQEKVNELLELYRNHHYHLLQGNVAPMLRIRDKISKLERELDE